MFRVTYMSAQSNTRSTFTIAQINWFHWDFAPTPSTSKKGNDDATAYLVYRV